MTNDVIEIVRVERKLFPPDQPATVYNKFRSHVVEMLLSDDVRWQMGGETSSYFEAIRTATGWEIGFRVDCKNWS